MGRSKMYFMALDKELNTVATLRSLNAQWRRRYNSIGDFEIQLLASDYSPDMQYVIHGETKEVAVINKTSFEEQEIGSFMTISGYFFEIEFTRKCMDSDSLSSRPKVEKWVKEQISAISAELGLPCVVGKTVGYNHQITGGIDAGEIGTNITNLLESKELSQKCLFDKDLKKVVYQLWQGIDRTQDQKENPYCVFSERLGNISDIKYDIDDSNYKNYCRVKLQEEDYDTGKKIVMYEDVDFRKYDTTGGGLRESFLLLESAEGETESEKRSYMIQQGTFDLLNHKLVTNISFKPVTGKYDYHTNYELGDKVDVVLNSLQKTMSYNIIEVSEVYKNNNLEVSITLGSEKVKQYQKGRY